MTEHQIQTFLWEQRDNWEDLIEEVKFPDKYIFDDNEEAIFSLTPDKVLYNALIDRLQWLYNNVHGIRLFGCEVPLRKEGDSTIRADLLGLIEGVSGITVIEIKKSNQTERQAFTELFAYASHLAAIFPTMSKDDIHYILISPMQERIVREAAIHSFLFDEKPVFAFIPVWENDDVSTLKLRPWIPRLDDLISVTEASFSQKNFEVFKVTWDYIDGWNAAGGGNPDDHMVARMNDISGYAAQLMEAKGVHGFVYTLQSYPELPFLPNAIVIVAMNPFKIAKDHLLLKQGIPANQLDEIGDEEINLMDIIPELKNKAEEVNSQNEYFYDLASTWPNTMHTIAFDTVEVMTHNHKNIKLEQGWGGMTWDEYQVNILEDILGFNFSIKATGLLRTLYTGYTKADFDYISKFGYQMHPRLAHGDFPVFVVDYFKHQIYFREFLRSIFDAYKDILDEFDNDET